MDDRTAARILSGRGSTEVPKTPVSRVRQGVIGAVGQIAVNGTVSLFLGSDRSTQIDGVSFLTGYWPAVGDTVWIAQTGTDLLVLGPVTASTGPQQAWAEAAGSVNVTLAAAVSGFTPNVAFPTGRFTVAPLVLCTLQSGAAGTQKMIPRALTITSTKFDQYVYIGDGSTVSATVTVAWHAIQMTPTSAAG